MSGTRKNKLLLLLLPTFMRATTCKWSVLHLGRFIQHVGLAVCPPSWPPVPTIHGGSGLVVAVSGSLGLKRVCNTTWLPSTVFGHDDVRTLWWCPFSTLAGPTAYPNGGLLCPLCGSPCTLPVWCPSVVGAVWVSVMTTATAWEAVQCLADTFGVPIADGSSVRRGSTRYRVTKSTGFQTNSEQFDTNGTGERTDGRQKREEAIKAAKRKRRAVHAALVRLLEAMERGEHGVDAIDVAWKWLPTVKNCGGRTFRHGACGHLAHWPLNCAFPLCPHYQRKRGLKLADQLGRLWTAGYFKQPKLDAFTVPNVAVLGSVLSDFNKALTALHRRTVYSACRGGWRGLEVTFNGHKDTWHPHAHELNDRGWVAQYPQTDIVLKAGEPRLKNGSYSAHPWKVVRRHAGVAREWTAVCQRYPTLKSPRPDFDIDVPEHWYFVDMKVADAGTVYEVAKYVTKGSDVVAAGADRLLELLSAMRGVRMSQGFGHLYGKLPELADDEEEGTVDGNDSFGHCPYHGCPSPSSQTWEFVCMGVPDGYREVYVRRTRNSWLVPEGGGHGGGGDGIDSDELFQRVFA